MAVRVVPPGVTCGEGAWNFVHCKIVMQGDYRENCYYYRRNIPGVLGQVPHLVMRYTDLLAEGPALQPHVGGGFRAYGLLVSDSLKVTFDSLYHYPWWNEFVYYSEGTNLTIEQHDIGTTAAAYGTSQYPSGYAPVPTDHTLHVGAGQTYATIELAYAAAAHGDNIIVHPGSYNVSDWTANGGPGGYSGPTTGLGKCVRIYGSTGNPDDVVLYTTDGDCHLWHWSPFAMTNVPLAHRGFGFFHVTIKDYVYGVWFQPIFESRNDSPDSVLTWDPGTADPPPYVGHPEGPTNPCAYTDQNVCLTRSTSRCQSSHSVAMPWNRCT